MIRNVIGVALIGLGLASSPAVADRVSALAALRAQEGVMGAQADARGNAYVTVKQAHWDWNNWARAACRVVIPHQGQIFHIRVVLITEAKPGTPPAKWPRLGEATCR